MQRTVQQQKLDQLIAPIAEGFGCEYVGHELTGGAGHQAILRVFVDKPGRVTIDDCTKISHQLNAVLDVENVIPSSYRLEVSSPGLDRPLFFLPQFQQAVGQVVKIKMAVPINGRSQFTGTISAIKEGDVIVLKTEDGEEFDLSFGQIAKANIVFKFK